jgi:hypothetical protein
LFEVWQGANSRMVSAVLGIAAVGLAVLGVWLLMDPVNGWGAYAALGGAVLAGLWAGFEYQAREDRVRVYRDRIEEWRGSRQLKQLRFDRGPSYTFGFTPGGGQHTLSVADESGAQVTFNTALKEGAPPAGAQPSVEQLTGLRDLLQQVVEGEIEQRLERGEPFKVDTLWTLYPDRVEMNGHAIPWEQATVECSNTTGMLTVSSGGGRTSTAKSLTGWNAIPAANAMLSRAAAGGWT